MTTEIQKLTCESCEITNNWGFQPTNFTETSAKGYLFVPVTFSFPEEKKKGRRSIKDFVSEWEKDPEKSESLKKARMRLADKLDDNGNFSLSKIRLKKGLSQTQLAERMGINQPYIAKIENGKDDVKISTIESLASALEEQVDIIFTAIRNQRKNRRSEK